ncbi:ODV-EC43 [Rachiplusia nu nucleopolyhedrovirus]|uniref:ODV-EC43 n=1 Tax=Rachiplusia nu nucleopolyhedrovirus TaxID=2605775 RepID=A0AAE6IS77_9ABAC|nr:ODV-EC43 [Rachiplusia nu nucleopolyhedrovirus]QEI03620.1 ODV-EC43 [Rachiplusia nu nucleopolyhedrovirus]
MTCPFNIKVIISDRFFVFPYEYVVPQTDLGGAPVRNLVIYVPEETDIQYVDPKRFANTFDSVLVYRHEFTDKVESRAPKKNGIATVVYWNPILPITEIGAGETRVFSVLLTDLNYDCHTMIIDPNAPVCPIQLMNKSMRKYTTIAGETPLQYINDMLDEKKDNFLICFHRETSNAYRLLNIKRILTIFEFRATPAKYAFDMPDVQLYRIYNELKFETIRRLMKGDVTPKCLQLNIDSLHYVRRARDLLGIPDGAQTIVTLVRMFQKLIPQYFLVPDIIIKLNTIDRQRNVRLYCKNDSFAISSYGPVPNNMLEDNPISFDYSDINTPAHLLNVREKIYTASRIENLTVGAARYNYFF